MNANANRPSCCNCFALKVLNMWCNVFLHLSRLSLTTALLSKSIFGCFFFFQLPRQGDRYQIVAAVIVDPTSLLKTMRVCLVTVQSDTAVALLLHWWQSSCSTSVCCNINLHLLLPGKPRGVPKSTRTEFLRIIPLTPRKKNMNFYFHPFYNLHIKTETKITLTELKLQARMLESTPCH